MSPDPYFHVNGAAGKCINYFNPVDYALGRFKWQTDQQLKPDFGYTYALLQKPTGGVADGFVYQSLWTPLSSRLLTFPQDRWETFAYADEAQSYALGSQAGVQGVFGREVNLNTQFGFTDEHKYHSGEFRSTIQRRWNFWKAFLNSCGIQVQ